MKLLMEAGFVGSMSFAVLSLLLNAMPVFDKLERCDGVSHIVCCVLNEICMNIPFRKG